MKRLTIFAHYDGQSEVKPYIRYLLERLRDVSHRIVFISASELPREQQDVARRWADDVIIRREPGYDFGMWKQGLGTVDLHEWDELVLTNSSIFGPVHPLPPLMERMSRHPCDFWGPTENWELTHHLQSYFLVFKRPVLRSEAFADFWRSVFPFRDKGQVIRSYEVGLTIYLEESGFTGAAAFPSEELFPPYPLKSLYSVRRGNTTCLYPDRLLVAGMPFVKCEALRDNPARVPLGRVRRLMERAGYDMDLIEFDRPAGKHLVYGIYLRRIQRPLTFLVDRLIAPQERARRQGA